MENISLESLDLNKNNMVHFYDKPDLSAEMSPSEKRRYRNKMLFVWGIPVACGIFSFIYWFVFVPVLWFALPYHQWPPVLWISLYGVVAFAVWLAIMALCLLWWKHKHNTIVKRPKLTLKKDTSNDSGFKDSPPFPTKVSAVQPLTDTPNSSLKNHRGSSVCVQVQPDNTPSLYNSRTGRESYEGGYQEDSEPTSSSVSVQSVIPKKQELTKQNSGVLLLKKKDSLNQEGSKKKRISSSDSEDFTKISRDSGDGLESCVPDNDKPPSIETVTLQKTSESTSPEKESPIKTDMVGDSPAPPFSREESFKGLPEMNSFGQYLHLVTIETPMSPREVFFSDVTISQDPEVNKVQMREPRDRKSYCVGDLSAAQQRITDARKSLPLLMYSSDIESGPDVLPPPLATPPPPTVLEIVDENAKPSPTTPQQMNFEIESPLDEGGFVSQQKASITSAEPFHSKSGSGSSGKYFIANVLRTESITSEVHLNIVGDSPRRSRAISWEAKIPESPSHASKQEDNYEGRWVLLSRDYAANNLEAFIRLESEATARERAEGTIQEDDDVFLVHDK